MVTIMSLVEFGNVVKFSPGAGNYHLNPELNFKMVFFWAFFFGGFLLRAHYLNKNEKAKKIH